MDMALAGRTVLVTGGSSGIGKAVTGNLLNEGANVVTCARRFDRLRAGWSHLDAERADRLALGSCDVRIPSQCEAIVDLAVDRYGGIDGVFANAGVGTPGTWDEMDADAIFKEVDMKLLGLINPIRAAQPYLESSDASRIVIIGAVSARVPDRSMVAIGAARAAAWNLSRALAIEFAEKEICVNSVNLGAIDTERQREKHRRSGTTRSYPDWARNEAMRRGIPLSRFGTVDEVAPLVTFLLSPLASYITGATIDVAGGMGSASA